MKELEAFVTLEAIDVVVAEVEDEVAISHKGIVAKGVEKANAGETTNVKTLRAALRESKMVKVLEDINAR